MSEYANLIATLRAAYATGNESLPLDAADAIEELERDLAEMINERDMHLGARQKNEPELLRVRAENAALRKDAERYRALREMTPVEAQAYFWNYRSRRQRDEAIDLAMHMKAGNAARSSADSANPGVQT